MSAFGALIEPHSEEEHQCSCFDSISHTMAIADTDPAHRSSKEASVKCSGCWRVVNPLLLFLSYRMAYWWMNLGCQRSLQHKCSKSTMDTMNYTFQIVLRIFFNLKFWRTCPSSVTLISLHPRMQYEWLVVFFLWRKLFYY